MVPRRAGDRRVEPANKYDVDSVIECCCSPRVAVALLAAVMAGAGALASSVRKVSASALSPKTD